jgi:hypothetical protein
MEIADQLPIRPNTVIKWRRRFDQKGLAGLADGHRSGKPVRYGAQATAARPWDGPPSPNNSTPRCMPSGGSCAKRGFAWPANAVGVSAPTRSLPPKLPRWSGCI